MDKKFVKKEIRILIDSWTGNQNIGDEAILYSTVEIIKKYFPTAKIFAITNETNSTKYFNPTVVPIKRISIKKDLIKLLRFFKKIDLYIIAGGQLIHKRSIFKYFIYILLAKFMGTKVLCNSLGVHKMDSFINKIFLILSVILSDKFTVRDQQSKNNVIKIINSKKVKFLPDPAFTFYSYKYNFNYENIFKKYGFEQLNIKKETPFIGISLRCYGDNTSYYDYIIKHISKFIKKRIKEGFKIVIIPLMRNVIQDDIKICRIIEKKINNPTSMLVLDTQLRIPEMLYLFSKFDLLIGARLHSLILAGSQNVPIIAIGHYWKVNQLMNLLGISDLYISDKDLEKLEEVYNRFVRNKNEYIKKINEKCQKYSKYIMNDYFQM